MKKLQLIFSFLILGFSGYSQVGICCPEPNPTGRTNACGPNVTITLCAAVSGLNAKFFEAAKCPEFDDPDPCKYKTNPLTSELTVFRSVYNGDAHSVNLDWEIPEATKNPGFYIERSRDGKTFKTIGLVEFQNNIGDRKYIYTDNYPLTEGYYRLQWMEGGTVLTKSNVIKVLAFNKERLQLLPNPATNKIHVLLPNMQLYSTEISVYDLSGRKVLNQKLENGQTELNLSTLSKGTFVIQALQNNRLYIEKVIRN